MSPPTIAARTALSATMISTNFFTAPWIRRTICDRSLGGHTRGRQQEEDVEHGHRRVAEVPDDVIRCTQNTTSF
jgi:hypothetical protein